MAEHVLDKVGVQPAARGHGVPDADAGQGGRHGRVVVRREGVNVVAHRAWEHELVLGDGDEARAEVLAWGGREVDAVDGERAGRWVEETEEDEKEGGFAARTLC